jgi:hypothetical protein
LEAPALWPTLALTPSIRKLNSRQMKLEVVDTAAKAA